jgi:hypothetical protein
MRITEEPCTVTISALPLGPTPRSVIRGTFGEMPGLRLSAAQAVRFFSMDRDTCIGALDHLTAEGFLELDAFGRYRRTHVIS